MRRRPARAAERGRIRSGFHGTRTADGCVGAFQVGAIRIIASDGSDWSESGLPGSAWEYVSVSLERRTPTWEEMQMVKEWFWGPEEVVMQLHPARSEYVNMHPHCLHLWKPIGVDLPVPPSITVGLKGATP